MKCKNCGSQNKDGAKFCSKCGGLLEPSQKSYSKYLIILLMIVIIVLAGSIAYLTLMNNSEDVSLPANNTSSQDSQNVDEEVATTVANNTVTSSQPSTSVVASQSKSWVSIGKYSGSGSGSETIDVPEGKIMVKFSAYPIKNYASNYLQVLGSNGEGGAVDWGSNSAVKTKSGSFTYESSSHEEFTIDYYETVSWEVEFFRYQ